MPTPTPYLMPLLQGEAAAQWLATHRVSAPFLEETAVSVATKATVKGIISDLRQRGDAVLYELAARFGDALEAGQPIELSQAQRTALANQVSDEAKASIDEAYRNIRQFGEAFRGSLGTGFEWEQQGYRTGFHWRAVASVGCYVPAGRYPLVSSALMTAVTARCAGVQRVVMACPNPCPEVLYAAQQAGVDAFYLMGGAQALAAWAFGTEQVEQVDMVVGPGNRFVNEAKRQLLGTIGIDLLAGPSEVAVVATAESNPAWVASDLLAQAEHDPDARSYLLTDSLSLAEAVQTEMQQQLAALKLPAFLQESSLPSSVMLVLESEAACIEAANVLAAEHLHLHGDAFTNALDAFQHYGTAFVGSAATVAFGDYLAGPNHTLPTGRASRFSNALSPLAFLRVQNTLHVPAPSPYLAQHSAALARMEGLTAHAHSALLRG